MFAYTAQSGSKVEEALNLLASSAATLKRPDTTDGAIPPP
jgi:hypothetical protein